MAINYRKRETRLTAGVLAALTLGACSQAVEPSTAAPHASVRTADYFAPILNMEIDFGESPRSGALIKAAGDEALAIGKAMVTGKPPVAGEIKTINFVVLGKAGADPSVGRKIVHFTIDGQELRQLAHFGVDGANVIESARDFGSWTPANDDVVTDYCNGSKFGICAGS